MEGRNVSVKKITGTAKETHPTVKEKIGRERRFICKVTTKMSGTV